MLVEKQMIPKALTAATCTADREVQNVWVQSTHTGNVQLVEPDLNEFNILTGPP